MFLYIDPLKQGLKLQHYCADNVYRAVFLYIDPLKQGLKPAKKKEYLAEQAEGFYT